MFTSISHPSLIIRLYDFHPNGQEALLVDTMQRLKWSGVPWEKVFSPQVWRGPIASTHG